VRRLTGGRALLHDDEVTYSVIAPLNLRPEFQSLTRSYRLISSALVEAMRALGIPAQWRSIASHPKPGGMGDFCFGICTRADLVVGSAKIVGSAQSRRHGVLLQHGSIPLTFNESRQKAIFGEEFVRARVQGAITCLKEQVAAEPSRLMEALVTGFQRLLGPLNRRRLRRPEVVLAQRLAPGYSQQE